MRLSAFDLPGTVALGLTLGAYAPRSHNVIDTLGCKVVAPVIDEVATWVRGAAETASLRGLAN